MPAQNSNEEILVDRRTKLDGGLNTRSNPFATDPSQCTALQNFRLDEQGSLRRRDGGDVSAFDAAIVTGIDAMNNSAPVISDGGAGSIGAGTYTVKIGWSTWSSLSGFHSWSVTSNNLVLGANKSIRIMVRGNRLGFHTNGRVIGRMTNATEGDIIDDPFMGGPVSGELLVAVRETSQANYYLQASPGNFFAYGESFTVEADYAVVLTTYSTSTIVDTTIVTTGTTPVKHILHHRVANMVFLFAMDSLIYQSVDGSITKNARFEVKAANADICAFSRSPRPMSSCVVSRVPIYTDGLKPKKISYFPGFASANPIQFSQLGADPPGLLTGSGMTPTRAAAGAGVLTGTYLWKISFIYQNSRFNGSYAGWNSGINSRQTTIDAWNSESNSSNQSQSIVLANQQVTITTPGLETNYNNILAVRVYRTKAGGTTFFKVADSSAGLPAAWTGYTDNIADSALDITTTPADSPGKDPCDMPPSRFVYLQEHQGRVWGVVGKLIPSFTSTTQTNFRAANVTGTAVVRVSKLMLESSPLEQSTIDHYPNTLDYTVQCGSGEITALLSHAGKMYVFKEREAGVIAGDNPGEWTYRILFSGVGAVPYSVVSFEGLVYFWSANRGAYAFDGSGYQWVGGDVFPSWLTDNNAGYWIYGAVEDQDVSEVRWTMTTMLLDPAEAQVVSGQGNLATVKGTWKEYVYNVQSGGWTQYAGASEDRNVMGMAAPRNATFRRYHSGRDRVIFGTTQGRVLLDHQLQTDRGTAIVALAELSPFTTNPEMVKMFRKLLMLFTLAARTVGNVTMSIRFQQTSTYTAVGSPVTATTNGDRSEVFDIPPKIADAGAFVSNDRGLQVRIDSTVDSALVVKGVYAEFKEVASGRKEVRGT